MGLEGESDIGVPGRGPLAVATATSDHYILFSSGGVRTGGSVAAGRKLGFPEGGAGSGVDGADLLVGRCGEEDEAPGSGNAATELVGAGLFAATGNQGGILA